VAWSALYGAAVVVVPGALMARGMTSRLSSVSPGASAVSFMLWEMVKIAVSVPCCAGAEDRAAPELAGLAGSLVVCMKVYWVALLWRGRLKNRIGNLNTWQPRVKSQRADRRRVHHPPPAAPADRQAAAVVDFSVVNLDSVFWSTCSAS
jgi:hypothetical protein